MIRLTELKLPLSDLPISELRRTDAPAETDADRAPVPHPIEPLKKLSCQRLGIEHSDIDSLIVFKRSFDARKKDIQAVYIVDILLSKEYLEADLLTHFKNHPHIHSSPSMAYTPVTQAGPKLDERPVVVGFGPCGIFAALTLAQMGFKPIVLERGKTVRKRTKDTWNLWRKEILNSESNVQFGEGGAGTFSDGKLYSQIKDPRHLGRQVMRELVKAGAPIEILTDAHPHIGTFKLVKVVENLRAKIIALGGEIFFEQKVIDINLTTNGGVQKIDGLTILKQDTGEIYQRPASHVVMAVGHSSRDTFAMLYQRGLDMHAKPFSIGFRIEHPQSVIDQARWGRHAGNPLLGAADYKLVHHAKNNRSVYSFCMCPGGTVVAATSEHGLVVTNGMSQYSRNERNANAGIVVGIEPKDFIFTNEAFIASFGENISAKIKSGHVQHPLSGIVMQRQLEAAAFTLGGSNYKAPAQLVGDFLASRASTTLGSVSPSYKPGVLLGQLDKTLPSYAIEAIREALPAFGKKIKGFDMSDALLTGVETRTSSPLKMPRLDNFESTNVVGLYPAGEGASYAGGILSAGVDGLKVGEAIGLSLSKLKYGLRI